MEPTVYISLTTIFQRQRQCAQAIQSLLQQTLAPKKIYLFVSDKPYLLDKGIRQYCLDPSLTELTLKYPQLEVEWVENEGPYRKLLPALKKLWQRENTLILTCDDDVVYKKTFVETAVKLWKEKKCCIGFEGSQILPSFEYNRFPSGKGTQNLWNLATGVGGILYDPKWFSNKEIFKWKEFPYNDDLWFTAWRIAANIECYIHNETSIERSITLKEGQTLWTAFNNEKNKNGLEKIIHLFVYKGYIQKQESFFEPISQILFKWNSYIQIKLIPLIKSERLEGSIWNKHMSNEPDMGFFEKQKNLIYIAQTYTGSSGCEIGFNAGFSALLLLMANPSLKLLCLDLGEHDYTKRCFEQVKQDFGDRISLLLGDSQQTMKTVQETFDFVHVDGGHTEAIATADCQQALRVLNSKGFLLVDDTNLSAVETAVKSVRSE
jgi:hypothetical protein